MMRHPEPGDFVNFAKEQLGKKKQQRILEHCKGCERCADLLLEAVRDHGTESGPLRLRWWNWVSIVVLVGAIVAIVVLVIVAGGGD